MPRSTRNLRPRSRSSTERGRPPSARQDRRCAFWILLALTAVIAGVGAGCGLLGSAANLPGQTVRAVTGAKEAPDPVDLQQKLMRFADEFSSQMLIGVSKLRRGTNALGPDETLKWKILFVTESCSIASEPNAIAGVLDMTAFVIATRTALEEYWQPNVFGASADPILGMCRNLETNLWKLAGGFLSREQSDELRKAIVVWQQEQPVRENIFGARAVGFAKEVARANKREEPSSGSVFGLLGLDPLSGLDPATREIALTRMFAERALYVAQWMPMLLRWHIELLSHNAMAMPEVQQLVTNSTKITANLDRFTRVAERLPQQLSAERQEVLKALQSQETALTSLAAEVRQTLVAGSQMSTSLTTTLTTFDGLMKRFGVGEPKSTASPSPNSNPFRILDYAETATQLEATARRLTELVRSVDQTMGSTNLSALSSQAGPVIQSAQSAAKEMADYAFSRAVWLIVIACAAVLLTIQVGRWTRGLKDRQASD